MPKKHALNVRADQTKDENVVDFAEADDNGFVR